ncbi:hypothetical protein AGOR_G00142970 [Albula goreensis]|uniref:Chemokine interleukin-8-like domain-containing protein n=1 Tax=Albula goreensis TaxID=1534307 RepID=A0A8T3D524_9TELE|nr:hypothetical protein AGOR_G00142970 [Albula goreensis]
MASTRFFAVALLVTFTLNAFLPQTESVSCCVSYTKRNLHCKRMKGYTIQSMTDFCDLDAIIFHTKSDHLVCADPSKPETDRIIECLNAQAKDMEKYSSSPKLTAGQMTGM